MTEMTFRWREASLPDLASVSEIQLVVHQAFPEDDAVLADRIALSPAGCFMLEVGDAAQGYVLSHPWLEGLPPALNTKLGALPAAADTWYIHDLALMPETRGSGAGGNIVPKLAEIARREGFRSMSLVSVNGSQGFWARQGFSVHMDAWLTQKLSSYGEDAVYMRQALS
ncbi:MULTISPECIES: GNAT family N-acetyltransferase [Ensifer]|uniref:GNAT family N-acetyltransferase n=1 Tax=Ensifer TaxID=106591 RepID=UPI0008073560|nr:GNAT family N-acetyltransferase [Ensifer adhaerens]